MKPEFIFMLTRADRTIANARELLPDVHRRRGAAGRIKDVGLPFEALRDLALDVRHFGAELYIEVVSLDLNSEVESARVAVELGVDWLLGGTRPDAVLPIIAGTPIRYCPFPGRVVGHPSVLSGSIDDVIESASTMAAMDGVHGLDLLALPFAGDVPALISGVCRATQSRSSWRARSTAPSGLQPSPKPAPTHSPSALPLSTECSRGSPKSCAISLISLWKY